MTTTNEQHPMVKEFITLGEKYVNEVTRLERENEALNEKILDLMAFHGTRDEESFPSDITRRLVVDKESPVKVFREHRKLSQVALAEKSGISQAVISGIENGKRRGTVDNFKAIASALSVDLDDLV